MIYSFKVPLKLLVIIWIPQLFIQIKSSKIFFHACSKGSKFARFALFCLNIDVFLFSFVDCFVFKRRNTYYFDESWHEMTCFVSCPLKSWILTIFTSLKCSSSHKIRHDLIRFVKLLQPRTDFASHIIL